MLDTGCCQTSNDHCWHLAAVAATGGVDERCCWCGDHRMNYEPRISHGAFVSMERYYAGTITTARFDGGQDA